jgi:hypothetical protein
MRGYVLVFIAALIGSAAFAQTASPPAGATAVCKDGTYYTGTSHSGACSHHHGVQQWLANGAGGSAAPSAPTQTAAPRSEPTAAPMTSERMGGGPGQVWVNTRSHVYHCPGDVWYGKTKSGKYMSEADAKAAGNRPDHNKPCH